MEKVPPATQPAKFVWEQYDTVIFDDKLICTDPPWLRGVTWDEYEKLTPQDKADRRAKWNGQD